MRMGLSCASVGVSVELGEITSVPRSFVVKHTCNLSFVYSPMLSFSLMNHMYRAYSLTSCRPEMTSGMVDSIAAFIAL